MQISIKDIQSVSNSVADKVDKITQIEVAKKNINNIIDYGPTYINASDKAYMVSLKDLIAWKQALSTAYNLITKSP